MSLSIDYESVDDAQMRLLNTVVLYDGEPVYITSITRPEAGDPKGDIYRVYAGPLPITGAEDMGKMRKFISSRKFDLAPFPMGFLNYDDEVYYCSRLPRRQQRQGLSQQTFLGQCISSSDKGNLRLEEAVGVVEFLSCVKGTYPEFPLALALIEDGAKAVAFSRCFAAVRDDDIQELIYIYHKKEKVGFLMEGVLKLSKKGVCLKESLNEVGVPC